MDQSTTPKRKPGRPRKQRPAACTPESKPPKEPAFKPITLAMLNSYLQLRRK